VTGVGRVAVAVVHEVGVPIVNDAAMAAGLTVLMVVGSVLGVSRLVFVPMPLVRRVHMAFVDVVDVS
jgi:hypothetical protein